MPNLNHKDMAFFEGDARKGDIVFKTDRDGECDIALTDEYHTAEQDLKNRLLTQRKDWRSHPDIGADLERFVGQPNTRETGQMILDSIKESLMYDARFTPADTTVHVVPITQDKVELIVQNESNDYPDIVIDEIIKL